jgi:hypothetical protein
MSNVHLAIGFMTSLRPRKPHRAVSGSREDSATIGTAASTPQSRDNRPYLSVFDGRRLVSEIASRGHWSITVVMQAASRYLRTVNAIRLMSGPAMLPFTLMSNDKV